MGGDLLGRRELLLRNISILCIIMLRTPDCLFRWSVLWQKIKSGNIWICTEGGGLDLYQPEQGTFKHFNAHTGYHFSTDYLKDVVFDEANNCLWIAADFTNKVNCFHLNNYRNDIYNLEPLEKKVSEKPCLPWRDTPRKLYVGTTSAIVSLDKQTLKTEVLFHQKELFTHNYNTLLLDSKTDYGLLPTTVV